MLRFEPIYKMAPWGGRRLEFEFGRTLPEGSVGESWELCDFDDQQCLVQSGPKAGTPLGELWRTGLLGGSAKDLFPFLLKWVSTEDRLSVQVHPDEATCHILGTGRPKTEAWFVAQAEPGSTMLAGHYPGLDQATLRQASQGGTIHKWLFEISPHAGDMLLIPAGTLHAIGPGFLLLEVQQPSNSTFRVHDWNRLGLDGLPRPLHIDEACQAVNYSRSGAPKTQRQKLVGPSFNLQLLHPGNELAPGPLRVFVAHTGQVKVTGVNGTTTLEYGDVVVAESSDGPLGIESGTCVLLGENSTA